ncbi:hypothetical protein IEQ34_022340 [Dendrobium chrysotoxum]|uniref:TPX2 central domain-containing protein n=1 Tax=Dendrobium chrysotoxum TaxID=161865 RepID=A0AAV7FX80_DENCH|nr:hypothetical protein IEQ34_022340 [Dendrobium chrysotoxum]
MEGEMDLELEGEKDCHCSNVDIDYEYDAPRYFELGRKELASEAQQAELWFETGGNYPPSPIIPVATRDRFLKRYAMILTALLDLSALIVKISFGKKGKQENIDAAFFKMRDVDSFNAQMGVYAYMDSSLLCGSLAGLEDLTNTNEHAALDGTGSSNPFFMKPTTSQLSTQKLVKRSSSRSVCQKPLPSQSRSSEDPVHSLLQAAKRQKVDGGLVCKECFVNRNSYLTKMRLTIPREPVLETARRAKSFRAHRSDHAEGIKSSTSTFKALPLNRKILEAPSLPFPPKSSPKLPEFQSNKDPGSDDGQEGGCFGRRSRGEMCQIKVMVEDRIFSVEGKFLDIQDMV